MFYKIERLIKEPEIIGSYLKHYRRSKLFSELEHCDMKMIVVIFNPKTNEIVTSIEKPITLHEKLSNGSPVVNNVRSVLRIRGGGVAVYVKEDVVDKVVLTAEDLASFIDASDITKQAVQTLLESNKITLKKPGEEEEDEKK